MDSQAGQETPQTFPTINNIQAFQTMRFRARALDAEHVVCSVELDAADEAEARDQLQARRLTTLSMHRVGLGIPSVFPQLRQDTFDTLLFCQEFQALLAAGLAVVEALETLNEREGSAAYRRVLGKLVAQLMAGQRLSTAMDDQPGAFPVLLTGIVKAAEDTSDLPEALRRYVHYETQLQGLRHKVLSAAIYPSILLTVGTVVAVFLMGHVVPRFASVYQGNVDKLPAASQWLLVWGAWVGKNQLLVVTTLVALIAWVVWTARRTLVQEGWLRLLGWIPGAGPRIEVLELSRLYLTLGVLLKGGIPVGRAMQLARSVLSPARQASLEAARLRVTAGESLTESLGSVGLSTPIATRLLKAGERSGQLGLMLDRTAQFHETEIARWIERFSKTFEPTLMALIGLVIGLIVILLYMPIFDLAGTFQ